ncbi:MAG: hypothetical protein SCH68_10275 [Brevefilum sp.]|nr:hypothetical protein [Brevefilum sp.]
MGRFIEEMAFALSNFWDDVRLFFTDIGSVFEGMFFGLIGNR